MGILRILVVDDEPDVELLFKQRFRKDLREGTVEFHFAFSAEDGLQFLSKQSPPGVVLLLSDINMPGMNGLQLLRRVKADYPGLKVMMVTAYADEANRLSANSFGADEFLTKPVDFIELREKIEKLMNDSGS